MSVSAQLCMQGVQVNEELIRADVTLSLFELDAAYGNLLEWKLERILADLKAAARRAGGKLPHGEEVFITVAVECRVKESK